MKKLSLLRFKRPKKSKGMIYVLCAVLILSTLAGTFISVPAFAFTLSAGGLKSTIASIIISLLLQTGIAPTNTSFVNSLNNSYGITIEQCIDQGLLTNTGSSLIDSGLTEYISNQAAYSDLALNQLFETTAADAGVIAGSGATNIAKASINVGTGGTIGAFAGAVAVGVGAGVLIDKVRSYITDIVKYGFPMSANTRATILQNIPNGYDKVYYGIRQVGVTEYSNFFFVPNDTICVAYPWNNTIYPNGAYQSQMRNKQGSSVQTVLITYSNKTKTNEEETILATGPNMGTSSGNKFLGRKVDFYVNSSQDAETIINNYRNGTVVNPETIAPDIVTPQGNARMIEGPNGEDVINGLQNMVPDGYEMSPVDMEDYLNYINNANDNTDNEETGEEIQGTEFQDFISDYIRPIPDQPIIPDNPDPVPDQPERPTTPTQPDMPTKPDATPEDIQDMVDLTTTPDLRSVFPFCIPWDLYQIMLIFDTGEQRKAPHITFTFPFSDDWVIDVDLTPFDSVAGILRLLELILFIVGLAVATRALIGAGGS